MQVEILPDVTDGFVCEGGREEHPDTENTYAADVRIQTGGHSLFLCVGCWTKMFTRARRALGREVRLYGR